MKKMKILKVIISTVSVMLVIAALIFVVDISYIVAKYRTADTDIKIGRDQITDGVDQNELPTAVVPTGTISNDDNSIINILLVGSDGEGRMDAPSSRGGSDTTLIATLDMKHKKLKLTSLMRDCYVEIPGVDNKGRKYGWNKLNASYAFGGATLLIDTIEHNFKIKLNNYAVVNFTVFKQIIDRIGGIEINLSAQEALYLKGRSAAEAGPNRKNVKEGINKLDGQLALEYARARDENQKGVFPGPFTYTDNNGVERTVNNDFARTARQRYFLETLFNQVKGQDIITLKDIASSFMDNLRTNIKLADLLSFIDKAISIGVSKIDQLQIPVSGGFEDKYTPSGAAVLFMDVDGFQMNINAIKQFIFEN